MKIEISKSLTEDQAKKIDHLWNEVYPIKLKNRFGLLLKDIKEHSHHILLNEANEVIGWAVAFLRDDEIWFSILVSAKKQSKGYGRMLIDSLKQTASILISASTVSPGKTSSLSINVCCPEVCISSKSNFTCGL